MAVSFNSFPYCCTTAILVDLGPQTGVFDLTTYNYMVDQAVVLPDKGDFTLIIAMTTELQYTGAALLKEIGFTEQVSAVKESAYQRHRETGGLTLWTILPKDFRAWQIAKKVELEEKRKADRAARPKVVSPLALIKRSKYPRFTIESAAAQMRVWRTDKRLSLYYPTEVSPNRMFYSSVHYTEFFPLCKEYFGKQPSSYGLTWDQLVEEMQDWQDGFIA